jgi:hypothetical protein
MVCRVSCIHEILKATGDDAAAAPVGATGPAVQRGEAIMVRSLTETPRQIYRDNLELREKITLSTWYPYARRDFKPYKFMKRVLDCCKKCREWDCGRRKNARKTERFVAMTMLVVVLCTHAARCGMLFSEDHDIVLLIPRAGLYVQSPDIPARRIKSSHRGADCK